MNNLADNIDVAVSDLFREEVKEEVWWSIWNVLQGKVHQEVCIDLGDRVRNE